MMQIVSRDGGQTWVNPPRVVLSRPGSFIKSPPIRSASSMEWLLPIYQ